MNKMGFFQGIKTGYNAAKQLRGAATGKAVASAVTSGAQAASGTVAHGANVGMARKAMNYAKNHPYKATAMGAGGLGAASYISGRSRRGAGVSKTQGRPTGMYQY